MKKYAIFCVVFCAALIILAGADARVERTFELGLADFSIEAFQAESISKSFPMADVQKSDFRGIAPVRDVVLDETDYEPNDWDGSAWLPPSPWGGLIGALPAGETVSLDGSLDSTGFDDGWYTGDGDLYGFSLRIEGIMDMSVAFSPDCSEENIYNVWFIGVANDDTLHILDMNFPYPSVAPVTCPFEGSYAIDPYGEIDEGIYFINQFYVLIGGADGIPPTYTITWYFTPCDDLDGDGYYDEVCGGIDCDDGDPFVYPCALEIPGNGIDEDCSGADRGLEGDQVSEIEPNDDPETQIQDLDPMAIGDCIEISGNYCSAGDDDWYQADLAEGTGVTLTFTLTYEGITEELDCWAVTGEADFGFGIAPGDMDEDGYYDVGDYILEVCATAADDIDGDEWYSEETCGMDCDDTDPTIHPCAVEVCGDGIDQDCVGIELWLGDEVIPGPDGDLACGIDEIEPNDDIFAGIVHDLGVMEEGFLTIHGDISVVGDEGDYDVYQYEMTGPGFNGFHMVYDCDSDYDMLWLAYYDPDTPEGTEYELDWYIFSDDAWIYWPESMGGVFLADGGWDFPMPMAVWIYGYDGEPGDYYLEAYYDAACIDADRDGFGGGHDPSFYEIWEYEAECEDIDCDDTDRLVNPGMIESDYMGNCANGKDDDCDGLTDDDEYPDCYSGPHNIALIAEGGKGQRSSGYIVLILIPLAFVMIWKMKHKQ